VKSQVKFVESAVRQARRGQSCTSSVVGISEIAMSVRQVALGSSPQAITSKALHEVLRAERLANTPLQKRAQQEQGAVGIV